MKAATAPADFAERRESGETVFTGEIFVAQRDVVRLKDGSLAQREVVRHPGATAILPLLGEETVLLEWQYRYPLGRHLWEVPAGKSDPGETPLETAKRELREETGYEAGDWREILKMATCPGFSDEIVTLFVACELRQVGVDRDIGEFLHVEAFSLKDAKSMVERGDIIDVKTIVALSRL